MRLLPVLLILCLPLPAFAQFETVTATAADDFLVGAWTVTMPEGPTRQGVRAGFGPMRDNFCRLDGPTRRLRAYCLNMPDIGVVTRDGKRIHIVWGGAMLRQVTIEASVVSLHNFRGSFTVRLFGFAFRAPEPIRATRRPHLENVPDAGGKSALLAGYLRDGARLPAGAVLPSAAEKRGLGAVQRVIHMGRSDGAEVYAVQFPMGLRLCAIRQRGDGVVDSLRCV